MQSDLDALTRSLAGSYAFAGVAVSRGGQDVISTALAPGISADAASMFRVASLSKIVIGHALHLFAPEPQGISVGLRDRVVTLDMLAAHSAGLADMIVPTDRSLVQFLAETDVRIAEPGTEFHYSNLGYIILTAILEERAEMPFNLISLLILQRLGIKGGFNWLLVDEKDRQNALPIYRRTDAGFVAQIDGTISSDPVIGADGQGIDIGGYTAGWNPAVFAPHGGLRTNMAGILALAKSLSALPATPLWRASDGPGDDLDGLCQDYGFGVQILPKPPFYPRPLIGHFGSAYGLKSGAWYDAAADLTFAYALNGAALGDESDRLSDAERQLFETLAGLP